MYINVWDTWTKFVFLVPEFRDSLGYIADEREVSRIKTSAANPALVELVFQKDSRHTNLLLIIYQHQAKIVSSLTADKCGFLEISQCIHGCSGLCYWTCGPKHILKQQNLWWFFMVHWIALASSWSTGDWAIHWVPRQLLWKWKNYSVKVQ